MILGSGTLLPSIIRHFDDFRTDLDLLQSQNQGRSP